MTRAYPECYRNRAQAVLGCMLDFGVNILSMPLEEFWGYFLVSPLSREFAWGDIRLLTGVSGIELAWKILGRGESPDPPPEAPGSEERSQEYWTGWALARYQWETTMEFEEITRVIPINKIRDMYHPFHEMDTAAFVEAMNQRYRASHRETHLKDKRTQAGLSQSALAKISGVPVRTIQQYEQRVKSINNAHAESVAALARALRCPMEALLEYVP